MIKVGQCLRSMKDPLGLSVLGVYKIPCICGVVYIGQTDRHIKTRRKDHQSYLCQKCQRVRAENIPPCTWVDLSRSNPEGAPCQGGFAGNISKVVRHSPVTSQSWPFALSVHGYCYSSPHSKKTTGVLSPLALGTKCHSYSSA